MNRDCHYPTLQQRAAIQFRINELYTGHQVDLELQEAKYFWVTGFTRKDTDAESYQNGDDCSVASGDDRWYCRISESVVVVVNGLVFYFSFVFWYDRRTRSSYPRPVNPGGVILVEKWHGNGQLNLPLTPSAFIERVLVLHFCVRWCSRVPVCQQPDRCICNAKCRAYYFCANHVSTPCSCTSKVLLDSHNESINEYIIFDSRFGFQHDL